MLVVGSAMYLMIPGESNQRILHPAKVLEATAEVFVAEFGDAVAPAAGADVFAYAEIRGKFMQQGASVLSVRQTEPHPVIEFARVGPVVSAESRGSYRVCVATMDILARVGDEDKCRVMDISPEGFAAVVRSELKLGSLVNVSVDYEGQTVAGQARVQTMRPRPDRRFRAGFLSLPANKMMRKALEKMTGAVQRMQLRRLARTG